MTSFNYNTARAIMSTTQKNMYSYLGFIMVNMEIFSMKKNKSSTFLKTYYQKVKGSAIFPCSIFVENTQVYVACTKEKSGYHLYP